MSYTLVDYVKEKHPEAYEKFQRSLSSVNINQQFCQYHYRELKQLVESHKSAHPTEREIFKSVFVREDYEASTQFTIAYQANTLAIVRNMHSLPDIMAHVIYYALSMHISTNTTIGERDICLTKVTKKLKANTEHRLLLKKLNALTEGEDFSYLLNLGNYLKHRSNILPNIKVSLAQPVKYNFFFEEFDGNPSVDAHKLIEREFNRFSNCLVDIYDELKKMLLAKH